MNSSKNSSTNINETGVRESTPVSFKAQFEALLELIPEALVAVDAEGCIVLANGRVEKMFGYRRGELAGRRAIVLLPERFRKSSVAEAFSAVPLYGMRLDGAEFPIAISQGESPLETEQIELMVIRDDTAAHGKERELRESRVAFEALQKEFANFSHSISHDLRAPLRAMDGFAALLKKSLGEGISPESAHALERVRENALRMSGLIDGLLDYSALSWVAMTKRACHPTDIARKAFANLTPLAGPRQIDFVVEELPMCQADSVLVRRLFDCLLSNALKFTRKRSPAVIRVGCRKEDGEQAYFIEDNGVGFDMGYSGKLFHIFQRLHNASEYEGAGVGLAIVQRIVHRHGGRVWAESGVDRGATVYFTLGDSNYGDSA